VSEWRTVLAVAELEPGDVTELEVDGKAVAIFDAPDALYATAARCTHAGARLCDGYFDRHLIECPLHQGCFDVRDGRALGAPVVTPLETYPVRVVDGMVQLRIDDP